MAHNVESHASMGFLYKDMKPGRDAVLRHLRAQERAGMGS